jgi:hypothetical protein
VIINTSTPGAQITVVKRGEVRTHNTVAGIVKIGMVEQYEDQPVIVGTSPLIYDFQRGERGGGWGFGNLFWQNQKRVCQWVEIRASAPGQSAQQMIPVNGDDTEVFLQMGPAQLAPTHAATSVQQPRS